MIQITNKAEEMLGRIDFKAIKDHPNILIAARFWDDERYQAAKICYRFMRYIDDLIDDRKADSNALTCLEKQLLTDKVNRWIDCIEKAQPDDLFMEKVIDTVRKFKIPLVFFRNFARSMIYDINNNGFETFGDFLDYAEGASNGPASVFVHLCCLTEKNGEFIPSPFDIGEVARPCAIFSYIVHIIRDFQKDQYNNLNYFARDILRINDLTPDDLAGIARGERIPENFRKVIAEYCKIAADYKTATQKMIARLDSKLDYQYQLSLRIIFSLYDMVFERIDVENGNFTTDELNPTVEELKKRVQQMICK